MISRRDFGKWTLAGLPALSFASPGESPRIGVATTSFRSMVRTPGTDNIGDVIGALKFSGAKLVELSSANVEPGGPNSGPAVPPPQSAYPPPITAPTREQVAAAQLAVRNDLRRWRTSTPATVTAAIRAKFQAAGIEVYAYRVDYDDAFTPEEIDVTFRQARALGVGVLSTLTPLAATARLASYAEKHEITVALHNGPRDTAAQLTAALGASRHFRLNLDIGNFTSANQESVAFLQENHAAISHIQLKDRTRNGGGNEPFGEGDTPIKDVIALLKEKRFPIPAFVEYEYLGLRTPKEEVKSCLAQLS